MRISFAWIVVAATLGVDGVRPARLTDGSAPTAGPLGRGQCQAVFDVGVDSDGSVTEVRCLCGSPPLADALERAIAGWAFESATDDGVARASRVLVAAFRRPPVLFNVGPCGPPDATILAPADLPVPIMVSPPVYPLRALGGAAVIVEVDVEPSGHVSSARAVGGRTAFDDAAERAAGAWRFLPARRRGRPVPTVAYLVFVFQEPVVSYTQIE
jgi:TonB family protein